MKYNIYAAAAKSLQSCPTLCDPIDGSPPGSPVPGILQARTLEWDTQQLLLKMRRGLPGSPMAKTALLGGTVSILGWGTKILHT